VQLEPLCVLDLHYISPFHYVSPLPGDSGSGWGIGRGQNRSRFITLSQAATKSFTNFSLASSLA
jgi:hypothetical protein